MFLTIIFVVVLIIGIFMALSYDFEGSGWALIICSFIVLTINTIELLSVKYDYEVLKETRNAYQQTLDDLREVNNQFETLAIGIEIVEFNKHLATEKVQNRTWFYGVYMDDRINSINPVK